MHAEWWQSAVVYQVYLRSFADANGDGIGDLAGLRGRLPYLKKLGVDAVWLNPCFLSPQRDHGYDIADYFTIDPAYGDSVELRALVSEAHDLGICVLFDMVANHCSTEHEWFARALAASDDSPERARFLFREGRGADAELPPNNWQSVFGGPAWTRVVTENGPTSQWYFHSFDSGQPDFNWRNPEVAEYFESVLRFWYDQGIDGFRIDVAHGLVKAAGLPDAPTTGSGGDDHNSAMWDQPEVHEIYRSWRAIGDSYSPPKYTVGEIWVPGLGRLRPYLRPDELHQAFGFDLLVQPWHAPSVRGAIADSLKQAMATATPAAWVLNNHDVHRSVTRYGQQQSLDKPSPSDMISAARRKGPADEQLGRQRARAMACLLLALPGTIYLYQGEELGLPEVFDLPDASRQDPIWLRSQGAELGRDGCRVPLPWAAELPNFGFSLRPEPQPWLPQPERFSSLAVDRQEGEPDSTLALYRTLLALRRRLFGSEDELEWIDTDSPTVVAFRRGTGLCAVNFGTSAVRLPTGPQLTVEASSLGPNSHDATALPPNAAVWMSARTTAYDTVFSLSV